MIQVNMVSYEKMFWILIEQISTHASLVKIDMIFIVLRLEDHFNTDSEDSLFEGGENEDSDEDENEPIEIPWVEETEISRRVENNEDDPFPDTASIRYNMK